MGLGSILKKGLSAIGGPAGAIGVGGELLSGLFGAKSKKKQAEAQNKAAVGQAELQNQMSEDKRLGKLAAGQSILQQLTGSGFTNIDPETAAALAKRRTYDFSKAVPEAGAGMGSSLLSGLFGGISDLGYRAGIEADRPMSASGSVAPQIQTQDVVGVKPQLSDLTLEDQM